MQDVGVVDQLQGRHARRLGELLGARLADAPVRYRGDADRDVDRQRGGTRLAHLRGGLDRQQLDARGRRLGRRSAHDDRSRSRLDQRTSDREADLPEERLLMYRTGSMGSLVGPVVTSAVTPASGGGV